MRSEAIERMSAMDQPKLATSLMRTANRRLREQCALQPLYANVQPNYGLLFNSRAVPASDTREPYFARGFQ